MQASLELLNNIKVASPCPARWEEMTGDDLVRHCEQCDKNVYNMSGLSAEAAANLFREKEGKLCVRFFRRADGTMLTADCPVGLHHRIRRTRRLAVLAASFAGFLSLTGCEKAGTKLRDDLRDLLGITKPTQCVGVAAPIHSVDPVPEQLPPPREVNTH
jgi:hypothetical protein